MVYLSGGNTFHYPLHLRRSGLIHALRDFADRGGVLAGLSAGAILATPHIGLAAHPDFDRDERSRFPDYACNDGSGIVVEGDRFTAHGDVWLFDRGRDLKIRG